MKECLIKKQKIRLDSAEEYIKIENNFGMANILKTEKKMDL